MIFQWGVVESTKGKKGLIFLKEEDIGIFRPSYGKIGKHLIAQDVVPILLLSATCRPVAVSAIKKHSSSMIPI